MTSIQYSTALVVFFPPYILFEIPSNILLKKLKPNVWLSLCMFGFGLVTICQGLVTSYGGLLATRFFLGLTEAGMVSYGGAGRGRTTRCLRSPHNALSANLFYHFSLVSRMFLLDFDVVSQGGGSEALHLLLCFYHTCRCIWRSTSQRYRQDARSKFSSPCKTFTGLLGLLYKPEAHEIRADSSLQRQQMRGYNGWRWIFILEGVLTCLISFAWWYVL